MAKRSRIIELNPDVAGVIYEILTGGIEKFLPFTHDPFEISGDPKFLEKLISVSVYEVDDRVIVDYRRLDPKDRRTGMVNQDIRYLVEINGELCITDPKKKTDRHHKKVPPHWYKRLFPDEYKYWRHRIKTA